MNARVPLKVSYTLFRLNCKWRIVFMKIDLIETSISFNSPLKWNKTMVQWLLSRCILPTSIFSIACHRYAFFMRWQALFKLSTASQNVSSRLYCGQLGGKWSLWNFGIKILFWLFKYLQSKYFVWFAINTNADCLLW